MRWGKKTITSVYGQVVFGEKLFRLCGQRHSATGPRPIKVSPQARPGGVVIDRLFALLSAKIAALAYIYKKATNKGAAQARQRGNFHRASPVCGARAGKIFPLGSLAISASCCLFVLLPTILFMFACSAEVGVLLEEPRIVSMTAEPPALVPPGAVTASVKIFDPAFRAPTIHWYVSANPPRANVDYLNQDLSDPSNINDPDGRLLYVGAGTQVVLPVPAVPDERLPKDSDAIFDTFPFYALASVKVGDQEFKGFKQVRVILPTLVERVLKRQCEDDPNQAVCEGGISASEVSAAVAVRLNRNPRISDVRFDLVMPNSEYTVGMTMDLLKRREAETAPRTVAFGVGAKQGMRILPLIDDLDLANNPQPGQPGYNKIELDMLATAGKFYPLSLTSFDWVPFEVKGGGFSKPRLEGGPHPLVTVQAQVYDRQGGSGNIAFEIDNGVDPEIAHQGSAGSVLLAEGKRMTWLKVNNPALLSALNPKALVEVSASVSYSKSMPHGIVASITAVSAATAITNTTILNQLDRDPFMRHGFDNTPLILRGVVVRTWTP